MRVAITGATGFLGSHVVRRLAEAGHDVVALRRPSSTTAAVDNLEIDWVVGDIADPAAVGRLVERSELVVHAAAVLTYWRGASAQHERVNVDGTATLAARCRAAGVRRLVHVSSVAALEAARDGTPADECAPLSPGSGLSYHDSKRRAEEAVLLEVERGLDAVIVNPSSLHGPHGPGFRGGNLIEGVRRRPVVPYYRGGTSIAHVDDVVGGIVGAAEKGRCGERYILAGENHSWRELAETAAEELSVRRVFVPVPRSVTAAISLGGEAVGRRMGRRPPVTRDTHLAASQRLYFDSGKAGRELDYHFRPYREIVREYLRSYDGARS